MRPLRASDSSCSCLDPPEQGALIINNKIQVEVAFTAALHVHVYCSGNICCGQHVAPSPVDCRSEDPLFVCMYAHARVHEVAGKGVPGEGHLWGSRWCRNEQRKAGRSTMRFGTPSNYLLECRAVTVMQVEARLLKEEYIFK